MLLPFRWTWNVCVPEPKACLSQECKLAARFSVLPTTTLDTHNLGTKSESRPIYYDLNRSRFIGRKVMIREPVANVYLSRYPCKHHWKHCASVSKFSANGPLKRDYMAMILLADEDKIIFIVNNTIYLFAYTFIIVCNRLWLKKYSYMEDPKLFCIPSHILLLI